MDLEQSFPEDGDGEPAQGVSTADAQAFLVARFGEEVRDVASVARGEWSKAFTYRRGGAEYVVRFSAHVEDFAKDRWAARYSCAAMPIPNVTEVGEAFGEYYAISERAFGNYLDELGPTDMRALLPALFAMLDAARLADLSTSTGYGGWGADGNAAHPNWEAALLDVATDRPTHRVQGWWDRMGASATGTAPFATALEALRVLVSAIPVERHLIHSDLLHYNVLVGDSRITAVIDWGCAKYGDFLYDLAWFEFWAPWYPSWHDIDFRREAVRHYESIGLDVPNFDQRLRSCALHIGLDAQVYYAFKGNWSDLDATAKRTLAFANDASGPHEDR